MLKDKCSVWKRIKFPTFWYNCYYFTWSDTYFIQLETLLINHPSYIIINTQLATCSTEPSSGQLLIHRHSTFSECAHYGIPYCLQTILILKFKLKTIGRCIFCFFYIYFKSYIGQLFTNHFDFKIQVKNDWPIYLLFFLNIFQKLHRPIVYKPFWF